MANASVQLITAPWSGYSGSPGASATGLLGGGAATPVLGGTGFSWGSIVGSRVRGPIVIHLPSARGIPMTSTFVRRGLGQVQLPCIDDPTMDCSDPGTIGLSTTTYPSQPTGAPSGLSTALAQIFTPLSKAAGTIGTQYMSYQNPLLQKQTVVLTPQGQPIYATNQPSFGTAATAAAGSLGSIMPMILIVVLAVVVIGAAKK